VTEERRLTNRYKKEGCVKQPSFLWAKRPALHGSQEAKRDALLTKFAYKAACKASVNSSWVSTIGFAFMLLAFAAFSASTAISVSVTP
jgi:hypothetical protein